MENLTEYCRDVLHYGIFNIDEQADQFEIMTSDSGLTLIPIYPITYILDERLYNRIFTTLSLALAPNRTLIRPLSMQLIMLPEKEMNMSRGLFFPWRVGSAQRLTEDFDDLLEHYRQTSRIPIMDIIDWNFVRSPHLIVTGMTGAGKTFFLSYLLRVFHEIGDVLIIDPKLSDIARWAKLHDDVEILLPTFSNAQRGAGIGYMQMINKRLKQVEEVMYFRQVRMYQQAKNVSTDYRELGFRPYFIVADEIAALMTGASKPIRDEFQSLLTRIVILGRESGIYLILGMQSARAEYIPTIVRDSISVRVQLGRINSENTRFLFPELAEMPMIPMGGKGTGLISIAGDDRYAGIEPVATPTLKE